MDDIDEIRTRLTSGLLQATRQWRRAAEQALASHGISDACAAPLLWIGRLGEGVRQVTLASYVGIEGPSLVRLLDQLVASGLVERRDDPADRRANTIWLTEEGKHLREEIEMQLVALRERVLAGISSEDLQTTLRVLHAFDEGDPRSTGGRPAGDNEP